MNIKYMTGWSGGHMIKEVTVYKETEHCVWYCGHRFDKTTSCSKGFHDTWQKAKEYLISEKTRTIRGLQRQLEYQKSILGNIKGMKESE